MTDKNNRILIITGGKIEDDFLAERISKVQYTMMIAADHGLVISDRLKLPLDFIVGDFDSVPQEILQKYNELSTPIKTFPKEKDKTDTQIALELALMQNPSEIDIIGATGSRLDHTMANIHLLILPLQLKIKACLLDRNNKIYLKNENFTILKNEQFGDCVSLLPFTEQVSGLTLKGFKYPLNHIVLTTGTSLGISNEIVEEEAKIELSEGILLVVESMD